MCFFSAIGFSAQAHKVELNHITNFPGLPPFSIQNLDHDMPSTYARGVCSARSLPAADSALLPLIEALFPIRNPRAPKARNGNGLRSRIRDQRRVPWRRGPGGAQEPPHGTTAQPRCKRIFVPPPLFVRDVLLRISSLYELSKLDSLWRCRVVILPG